MSVLALNKSNFDEALNTEKTVLVDFWAPWCGPCRMLSPIVDQVAEENPDLVVGKVNVDEEPELAREFKVQSIPFVAFVKDNVFLDMSVGYVPKDKLKRLVEEYR